MGTEKHILVVEDEAKQSAVICEALRAEGLMAHPAYHPGRLRAQGSDAGGNYQYEAIRGEGELLFTLSDTCTDTEN